MFCTSSYNSFVYQCLDQLRAYWKYFQEHSPILNLVKSFADAGLKEDLFQSQTHKRANSEDYCKAYHQSIAFNDQTKQGIFKYHSGKSEEPKPLVVICMGNGQEHCGSEKDIGMLKIYKELSKRNDVDVLLCRVGCSQAAINHRLGLNRDSTLHPDIVLDHIANLIDDRNHSRGIFVDEQKPSKVILAGYSWGGGAVKEISERWDKIGAGLKIPLAVTLDAIKYGIDHLGDELRERPKHAEKVFNIYQNGDAYLNGSTLSPCLSEDCSDSAEAITGKVLDHKSVDDDPWIREKILSAIEAQIKRPL